MLLIMKNVIKTDMDDRVQYIQVPLKLLSTSKIIGHFHVFNSKQKNSNLNQNPLLHII